MNVRYVMDRCRECATKAYEDAKAICVDHADNKQMELLEFYCAQFVSNVAVMWLLSDSKCDSIKSRNDITSLTTSFHKYKAKDFITDQWVQESIEHMLNQTDYMQVFGPVFKSTLAHDPLLTAARAAGGLFEGLVNSPQLGGESEVDYGNVKHHDFAFVSKERVDCIRDDIKIHLRSNRFNESDLDEVVDYLMNNYGSRALERAVNFYTSNWMDIKGPKSKICTEISNPYWQMVGSNPEEAKQEILFYLRGHGFETNDAMYAAIYLMNKFGRDAVCEAMTFYPNDWVEAQISL